MLDSNLLFSNGVTLTGTGNSSILDIQKWPAKGAHVELFVTGTVSGTSPTLDAKVQFSDSATFASGNVDGPVFNQITTTGKRQTVLAQSKKRYARIVYTVGGTTPSFGGVYAGVVSGAQRDDTA